MRAPAVAAFALFALAGSSARAQVVAPDDAPAPQPDPATQPPPPPPPPQYPAPQPYSPPPGYMLVPTATVSEQELQALEAHGRKFRAIGAVLIAIGAALDIAGLAMLIDYYQHNVLDSGHTWEVYASLGFGLGSAALLGAGIPILSSGIRDLRHARRIREGRVALAPTGISVTF